VKQVAVSAEIMVVSRPSHLMIHRRTATTVVVAALMRVEKQLSRKSNLHYSLQRSPHRRKELSSLVKQTATKRIRRNHHLIELPPRLLWWRTARPILLKMTTNLPQVAALLEVAAVRAVAAGPIVAVAPVALGALRDPLRVPVPDHLQHPNLVFESMYQLQ